MEFLYTKVRDIISGMVEFHTGNAQKGNRCIKCFLLQPNNKKNERGQNSCTSTFSPPKLLSEVGYGAMNGNSNTFSFLL